MADREQHRGLRIIAAFKLFKALALLVVAVGAFRLVRESRFAAFTDWIMQLPIHHGHRMLAVLVDGMFDIGPQRFLGVGLALCVYAAVFIVEGWGLWRGKRWAEYLTVVVTMSLIPIEVWEIWHQFTWLKVLALGVNVAIVVYLIAVLRRDG
jgi:uncharacterized membrane protein (DUF2068 family)